VVNDIIRYDNKIVTFLDILGFRNLVFQDKGDSIKSIRKLDLALRKSIELLDEYDQKWFSAKLFSDCICLSCNDNDLDIMLREVALLQLFLTIEGIFLTGAIARGLHFENERLIFSEGLINAYEMQDGEKYPRVIVNGTLLERMKKESCSHYGGQLSLFLIEGPDGRQFLDYLQPLVEEDGLKGEMESLLESHKNAIIQKVLENIKSPKVLDKYRWLSQYHNFKFREFYEPEDYFEASFEEMKCKLQISMDIFPSFKKNENIEEDNI